MKQIRHSRWQGAHARTLAAGLLASLVLLPAAAWGADYVVWGRALSVSMLSAGEEAPPTDRLADVPAEQKLVSGGIAADADLPPLVTLGPRNLVEVKVVAESDGTLLGSFVTRYDGGYLIPFSAPGPSIEVRMLVDDYASGHQLFASSPTELSGLDIRFLCMEEDVAEIGSGGGATTTEIPAAPAKYTGIFTRVGKIELATEVDGAPVELISSVTGLATVPDSVAADLAIPYSYEDAPFGGNLYLFGAFSPYLYSPVGSDGPVYYKIEVENPDGTSGYLVDPLVKTKYTIDFSTGNIDKDRVTLGPNNGSGTPDCMDGSEPVCYALTPMSTGDNVFWSFPDLLALWRTGNREGLYTLRLDVVGLATESDWDSVDQTSVKLQLDNERPIARIEKISADDDPATPRVYTPTPPDVPGDDLQPTADGDIPDDYGGAENPVCDILDLTAPPSKYLAFKLTAHHENGFMRNWRFRIRRNDEDSYRQHLGMHYQGGAMVAWDSPEVVSAVVDPHGFQDQFLYLSTDHLTPGEQAPKDCAYGFEIRAATRATDGYHYLRWAWDEDLHYIAVETAAP
jgi:hypothetical protein